MRNPDFRALRLATSAQWASGVLTKLSQEDGLGLFYSPSFRDWLDPSIGALDPILAYGVDECGQVLWVDCPLTGVAGSGRDGCRLRLFDPETGTTETLTTFDARVAGGVEPFAPRQIWVTPERIWLFDEGNSRLLGLSRDTFQIADEIQIEGVVVDIDFDTADGSFYALVVLGEDFWVLRYPQRHDPGTPPEQWRCEGEDGRPVWFLPTAIAVSRHWIWVSDLGPRAAGDWESRLLRIRLRRDEWICEQHLDACGDKRSGTCRPACQIVPIPRRRRKCDGASAPGIPEGLQPEGLEVDCQDNLLVLFRDTSAEPQPPKLVHFDGNGGLLGEIPLPSRIDVTGESQRRDQVGRLRTVKAGAHDLLYLFTDLGVARYGFDSVPIGESGVYYTRTLDNGLEEGTWHRLALAADLPPSTRIRVEAVVSDQSAAQTAIDEIVDHEGLLPHQKAARIEQRLGSSWTTVATFGGPNGPPNEVRSGHGASRPGAPADFSHDALFRENRGRYLWLKLSLSSFEEHSRPVVRELRIFHPRQSYLRYLPTTFQEKPGDPSSASTTRDFLERFLSLFESVAWGLDVELDHLFRYFDPDSAPLDFLPWLAGWLNLALEDDWPVQRKRELLSNAWELYERKGTASGLVRLVRIVTGVEVRIIEESHLLHPSPLGVSAEGWRLGRTTFVTRGPARRPRVGDTVILGRTALREDDPSDAYAASAHRFIVLIYGDHQRAREFEPVIRRLLDEHKPAHTAYTLRTMTRGRMGLGLRLGQNSRIPDTAPLRLGLNTALSRAINHSRSPNVTRLGPSLRVGRGFDLS